MNFYQKIISHKIKNLTPERLKELAADYDIFLSDDEAVKILHKVQTTPIDYFNEAERDRLIAEIGQFTSPEVMAKAQALLQQFLGQ